jgi:hypothetical protein
MEVDAGQFFVVSGQSAEPVFRKLDITDGANGTGIVFAMGSYYGRASTSIWDWIKSKTEKADGKKPKERRKWSVDHPEVFCGSKPVLRAA